MTLAEVYEPLRAALGVQGALWSLGYPTEVTRVGYASTTPPGGNRCLCAVVLLTWGEQEWTFTVATPEREGASPGEREREIHDAFAAWNAAGAQERIDMCDLPAVGVDRVEFVMSLQAKGLWPIPTGKA